MDTMHVKEKLLQYLIWVSAAEQTPCSLVPAHPLNLGQELEVKCSSPAPLLVKAKARGAQMPQKSLVSAGEGKESSLNYKPGFRNWELSRQ